MRIHRKKQIALSLAHAIGIGAFMAAAPVVMAQDAGTAAVERVTITGSSIKTTLEDQALPVQIMTRDDIAKSGASNMEQLINSLPAVSAAGGLTKSMGAGVSTYGQSAISLRGLGSTRTLVLVDGRRLGPFGLDSSAVDINAIPMESIERVEVLTDGASSIYGSDAVGGVVNFITRKNFEGAEISAENGQSTRSGGGDTQKFNFVLGKGSLARDKYNFMFTAGQEHQAELVAKDRNFAKSGNVDPYFSNGATGSGNIEGIWSTTPTSTSDTRGDNLVSSANPLGISSAYYGNPLADTIACAQDGHFMLANNNLSGTNPKPNIAPPSTSAGKCYYDSAPDVRLVPRTDKKDVSASFAIQLDPSNQFYGGGSWVENITTQTIQPSPVRTSFLETDTAFTGSGVSPALLILPGNTNYPTQWLIDHGLSAMVGQPLAVTLRTFLAGNRTSYDKSTQTSLHFGFKGEFRGWDYDTAITRDKSEVSGSVIDGYFSQLGLARALNSMNGGPSGGDPALSWNPWAPGGAQPAAVAAAVATAAYVGPTAGGTFTSTAWDGHVSNTVGKLAGGDVALSVGAEERHQQFEVTAPAILASGDIAGLGGGTIPMSAGRQITSVFSEVNLPFLTNFETNASLRADKYSDLKHDSTPITGKVSARWTPVTSLVMRGSYGTGFRAPSLSELYTPFSLGTTEQYTDPVGGANYQATAKLGGNPDLAPEKSKQWSLGGVFTPVKTVSLRADYFHIEVDNYITKSTAAAIVAQANGVSNSFVTFNADGSAGLIDEREVNAGLAKFEGFDLGANWSDKFGFGRVTVDYNGTYMTKATLDSSLDGSHEDGVGTQVDANGNALKLIGNGGTILKYKHKLSVDWSTAEWGVTLTQNYTDKYYDGYDLNGNPHSVPAYSIYDLQARYTGIKNLSLALGVKNLFDKDPPIYINTTNFFAYGYDPAQYDPLARFVYAKATYKF